MKSKIFIYIFSVSLWIFCSTAQSFPTPQSQIDNSTDYPLFFPEVPGTWWKYDVTRYIPFHPDSFVNSEVTISIVSTDTLSNGLSFAKWRVNVSDSALRWEIFPYGTDSIAYIGQAGDSVMLYRSTHDTNPPEILLRVPPVTGQTWGMEGFTSFISSVDSVGNVVVPAGTFEECIHVSRYGGWWQAPADRLEWLKESVGFIKIIHEQSGLLNNKFIMTLKDYHIVLTSAYEPHVKIPPAYTLAQNFPNPFNPSTEIRFEIQDAGFASLKIFDLLGREMTTLVNQELSPGSYRIVWDARDWPGGIYFYKLRAGNFVQAKKLVYLK